jgi:hypothetical protein
VLAIRIDDAVLVRSSTRPLSAATTVRLRVLREKSRNAGSAGFTASIALDIPDRRTCAADSTTITMFWVGAAGRLN